MKTLQQECLVAYEEGKAAGLNTQNPWPGPWRDCPAKYAYETQQTACWEAGYDDGKKERT